mgnify:CR=1 FL=1
MIKFPNPDIIADAINSYGNAPSTDTLTKVLEAFSILMQEAAEVLIPVVEEDEQVSLLTLMNENNQTFVIGFTSEYQAKAAGYDTTISRRWTDYLSMILEIEGCAGLCVNPGDKFPFSIQKLMINALIAESEKEAFKNSISLFKGDITTLKVDCIVNAANNSLLGGGGVDGAIHAAAGPDLLAECRILQGCPTGQAKITNGYKLPAKYVIHTVGPIYNVNSEDPRHTQERTELGSCYRSCLELAKVFHIHSIAFPCISCGAYGYPLDEATKIAFIETVQWLNENPNYGMQVTFVCFNDEAYNVYETVINKAQNPDPDAPNFMTLFAGMAQGQAKN